MREIKFRAWNKKLKCWGGDIAIRKNGVHTVSMLSDDVIARGDTYEIMQYTGLKDKNGTDVYEGDIVSMREPTAIEAKTFPVLWDSKTACFEFSDPQGTIFNSYSLREEDVSRYEVIGNIYENPELLP